MTFEAAFTFFIAIFIFGITPGPGIFALLARAMSSGARECLPLSLGMTISDIVYLILATFGLAAIAENYAGLFIAIRIIGAGYLIYLGWKMWTAEIDTEFKARSTKPISWLSGFVQGFLISASNPKVILFYIAFLPTFVDLPKLTSADVVLVCVLTFFALMLGLMMVSIGASTVRRYLKSEKAIRRMNRSSGSIMMGAGLFLLSRGMNH